MITKEEFDKRKELIDLEHRYKIEEIELEFKRKKEIQRIRSAEVRKSQMRRY